MIGIAGLAAQSRMRSSDLQAERLTDESVKLRTLQASLTIIQGQAFADEQVCRCCLLALPPPDIDSWPFNENGAHAAWLHYHLSHIIVHIVYGTGSCICHASSMQCPVHAGASSAMLGGGGRSREAVCLHHHKHQHACTSIPCCPGGRAVGQSCTCVWPDAALVH